MKCATLHPQARLRIETLRALDILDSAVETQVDTITGSTSFMCGPLSPRSV